MKKNNIKDIAEELQHKVWVEKDLTIMDTLIHKNIIAHGATKTTKGSQWIKEETREWLESFPDLQVRNYNTVIEGDVVTIQWEAKGTILNKAKNGRRKKQPFSYSGYNQYRVRNGKIVEYWYYLNMHHLLNQLI